MFNFFYAVKNIKNIMFIIHFRRFVAKKNVVINYMQFVKFFASFDFFVFKFF